MADPSNEEKPAWEETVEYHPEADATEPDPRRNANVGLVLFFIYLLIYGGFIALAVFALPRMAGPGLFGVNLAITYGIGLIVAALVLALIYMYLCRIDAPPAASKKVENRK